MPRQTSLALEMFDPSSLGDPVAELTEWTPYKIGGASFCTHVLREPDDVRMSFRPTAGGIGFCVAVLGAGCAALVGAVGVFAAGSAFGLFPLLVGAIFALLGAALLRSVTKPIVFDRGQGLYWRGRQPTQPGDGVTLRSIHALQIISEYCASKKGYFYSYELNLVLVDGERVNVVDHGDLARLRSDAATLARFLNVPLWDPEP